MHFPLHFFNLRIISPLLVPFIAVFIFGSQRVCRLECCGFIILFMFLYRTSFTSGCFGSDASFSQLFLQGRGQHVNRSVVVTSTVHYFGSASCLPVAPGWWVVFGSPLSFAKCHKLGRMRLVFTLMFPFFDRSKF
jgi:hypothetical protein